MKRKILSTSSNAGIPPDFPLDPFAVGISIRGARTHNLQGIDVDIPWGKLTTISGISGSGKSSLAFDTIYAEGLHRYLATVSPQTRDMLKWVDRPDVDWIDGLPPTLGIEQRSRGSRRRTTLATIAGLYDYFRILFSRVGKLHCPHCGQPVTSQSREAIVDQVLTLEDRRKVLVLAPVIRRQAGSHSDVLARIGRDGFVRARVDGELIDLSSPPALAAGTPHDIDVVVDRLVIKEGIRNRVEESIDLALQLGQGQCVISAEIDGTWQDRLFSSRLACLNCGLSFPSIEPGDFSFNSPRGACPTCHGLGIVTSDIATEASTAIAAPPAPGQRDRRSPKKKAPGPDVSPAVEQHGGVCPDCRGYRLSQLPSLVLIQGRSIGELNAMTASVCLRELTNWRTDLESDPADEVQAHVVRRLLPEICHRIQVLIDLGLDYLTLNRAGETLSAGEFQRARLTASLGNQLTGVCYVIDEPTAGLHASDTSRLLKTLQDLRDQGNTLIVVEHDLTMIGKSDFTIEIGPGAGVHGGRLIAACAPDALLDCSHSITRRELMRRQQGLHPLKSAFEPSRWIRLTGASLHNLHQVTAEVPLGGLVCFSGVSGSGKTSLVMKTLVPAVLRALKISRPECGPYQTLTGVEHISRLIQVDQRPLGRSERSTPATYSGIWDEIRMVYAKTRESRLRGYSPRRFSPQHTEGRCPRCAGRGTIEIDRRQLMEWPMRCPECDGRRFNPQTLAVRFRGVSVADLLEMTFEQAADFFVNLPRLFRPLTVFRELGLGYLKLGQSATTLSGGEAQRVKLATELWKADSASPTLFVLDEPTAGLHAADIAQLERSLRRLIDSGHSVVVIEHNLDLISAADWVIDLGPGAGAAGGQIVAQGSASDVAQCESSLTGQALREAFSN